MINMQQLILGQQQVSGNSEQPQEEVQLTELLPVKQSRIRENNVFKDIDATDALKALRSFSGSCNDEEQQDYGLRIFKDNEINVEEEKIEMKIKRVCGIKRKLNVLDGNGTTEKKIKNNSNNYRNVNNNGKRSVVMSKKRNVVRKNTKKLTSNCNKMTVNKINISDSTNDKIIEEEDDNELSVLYEEEIPSYLDLDKTKDSLNDEVYVFRRERSNSCSLSQTSSEVNHEITDEMYPDDYEGTAEVVLINKFRDRAKNLDISRDELNSSISTDEERIIPMTEDNQEKELRLKIDAIIQANLLVERENNNVVSQDRTKLIKEKNSSRSSQSSLSPSSPASSQVSTIVTGDIRNSSNFSDDDIKRLDEDVGNEYHNQNDSLEKKYCCVVCDARFKGSGGLRNHFKVVHGAGPVFKCDECGKEFPLKERLKLHVRTHTGFKPYKCPECEKSFARGGQLVQHRRTHSQVKPYHCGLCSGTFTCAANLALHVKRHNGQKDHKCEICGRGFVRRDALKKHLECLHRDVKSFLCVICNKTFKGHLPQHMRTHARDRPHGCATCGQRFAQKSQLTVHQRTHSGQRPFRCLVCWQAFAHSTALKLHTRRHTGERPFKCVECNAGFTQLPHWKKHMKCIHGRSEPYGCKRCKSFFRIKSDLESHEKSCHPELDGGPDIEGSSSNSFGAVSSNDSNDKVTNTTKYKTMTVERMRLLLAVLLKRISKQERLDELGFGKRLIDKVLQDSLISAGKDPATGKGLTELEILTKNLETFLEWTVPKEHWENFRRMKKSPEDILETLTAT
ncbi:PREDICTED: zinc finger protein 37-like [Polistes canadensis]|uniref:zinc finger protein 37-like n=1 Tax=Polistes canadensis TaxID=91411 RepID=UPI000718B0A3|nr:PREDICTED: zinc finger protein 37-like [Polistes canadensis]